MTIFTTVAASSQAQQPEKFTSDIASTEHFVAERSDRFLQISLKSEHVVYSTSPINGGETKQIRFLVNHQSMESNDASQLARVLSMTQQEYHNQIAKELDLPPENLVLMGTAANINHVAQVQRCFKDLCVDVFVTAGVEMNAQRAGDGANWYETPEGNQPVEKARQAQKVKTSDLSGTINTILLINQPLTPGALAKAVTLASEGKSAALAELAVPSRASQHIATGTGTDQFVIAAAAEPSDKALTSASGHLKLGELIGDSVRSATLKALQWQNGLTAASTSTVEHALGRFGFSKDELFAVGFAEVSEEALKLAEDNYHAINSNARLVAAAYAYASLLDRVNYGSLPGSLLVDSAKDQAAQAAVAISGKPDLWATYWRQITPDPNLPLAAIYQAIALGWQAKWAE